MDKGACRRDGGRRVIFLGERRGAKAVADRATNRKFRYEVITGGRLSYRGVTKIAVMLESGGRVDTEQFNWLDVEVDIASIVLPIMNPGIGGGKAWVPLSAAVH